MCRIYRNAQNYGIRSSRSARQATRSEARTRRTRRASAHELVERHGVEEAGIADVLRRLVVARVGRVDVLEGLHERRSAEELERC